MAGRSPVLSGSVVWSGENPIISLKQAADGEELTNVTFFRIVYSPAGAGHAAFISTRSFGGLLAEYTDNAGLGRWLRDEMLPVYPHYADKVCSSIELVPAEFRWSGDPRSRWREEIRAADTAIELEWEELGQPFVVDNPGGSTGRLPYHVISLFVPAARATVRINGRNAEGRPLPRDITGTKSSTCFLAFSETWLTLDGEGRARGPGSRPAGV